MNEYIIIGFIVVGLSALIQLAVGLKTLFGNKDFATREDLLRLEVKMDALRRDNDHAIGELNAQITSLTSAVARLDQSLKNCFCRLCVNFEPRQAHND